MKAELLFAELFHSLLSLDDVLNVTQSFFIYLKIVAIHALTSCFAVELGLKDNHVI